MLKHERHQFILEKLRADRKVLSTSLSQELGVSEDTIRRDLKELERRKLLYKVHGGAMTIENPLRTYDERSVSNLDKKKIIAKKAVKLIHDGQVIIMSGSTTNLEIAKIIPDNIAVTIFTYSLPIALELTKHPAIEVIFIGGKLNKLAQVSVGIDVVNTISNIRADICFVGTGGIHIKKGMTEPDWEVAHIKRRMIEVSDFVVSICVSPKLMDVRKFSVVGIAAIDAMITNLGANDPILDEFKESGLAII